MAKHTATTEAAAESTTAPATMADDLNAHLESGGAVQVTTYAKSILYDGAKYAGWFSMIDGSLYVRRGRSKDRLSHGENVLVSIRKGRWK